jgi:hypothetical protein
LHVTDDMSCVWPDTVSITVISNYFRREKRRLTVRGFPPSSWFAIPDSTLFITITLSHSSSCFFISLLFLFYLLLHSCLTKRRCMSQHQSQSRPLVLRQAQEASLLSLKHSSSRTYQTLSTILITSAPGRTWGAPNPSCGYPRFLCPPPCHRQRWSPKQHEEVIDESGGGVSSFMCLASVGMWFSCSIEVGSSGSGGGSGDDRLVLTCVELQAVISSATLHAMGSRQAGPTLPRDESRRRLNDPPRNGFQAVSGSSKRWARGSCVRGLGGGLGSCTGVPGGARWRAWLLVTGSTFGGASWRSACRRGVGCGRSTSGLATGSR